MATLLGVLLVLALCSLIFGVTMTFLYSENPATGVITLICVVIALPLIGGLMLKQLHPRDLDQVLSALARAHDGDTPIHSEFRMLTRDGRV